MGYFLYLHTHSNPPTASFVISTGVMLEPGTVGLLRPSLPHLAYACIYLSVGSCKQVTLLR